MIDTLCAHDVQRLDMFIFFFISFHFIIQQCTLTTRIQLHISNVFNKRISPPLCTYGVTAASQPQRNLPSHTSISLQPTVSADTQRLRLAAAYDLITPPMSTFSL